MNSTSAIMTFTGKYINPFKPDECEIDILDIAHALSNTCRYGGHVPFHYSVAQHSVLVSRFFISPTLRLAALLHDAEEAYMCDIPTPIKKQLVGYEEAADTLRRMIFKKFGLFDHNTLMRDIKIADDEMYLWERMSIWGMFGGAPDNHAGDRTIHQIEPPLAHDMFLGEFIEINRLLKAGGN